MRRHKNFLIAAICLIIALVLGVIWFQHTTAEMKPTSPVIPVEDPAPADVSASRYPLTGVRLPEFDSQGRMTKEFSASGMSQLDAPRIDATNVTITTFGTNRHPDIVINLEQGTYDRASGAAKSDSRVRVQKDNVVITGTGMELKPKSEKVIILGDVKVVMKGTGSPVPRDKKGITKE